MPRIKIFEEPLISVRYGGIFDAAVFIALCLLIVGAAVTARYSRRHRLWRNVFQLASVFVLFFAVAIRWCAFRRGLVGAFIIGTDDSTAFANLFLWVILMFFTISLGRVFCGWVCPVGTIQEWGRWLIGRRLPRLAGLAMLAMAVVGGLVAIWLTRPARFFLTEYPMAFWGIAAAAAAATILLRPEHDRALRLMRYSSAILAAAIALLGPTITGPACFIFKNELDYSSIIGTALVVLASAVVMRSWCRYLCPFGGIFSLVGRKPLLSVTDLGGCTGCGVCADVCPTGARKMLLPPERRAGAAAGDSSTVCGECHLCGRCADQCPHHALKIARREPDGLR